MASTSGSVTNNSTGSGSPYPNTFTLDWSISSTSGNTYTINWSVTITGGSSGYCQSYWNGVCSVSINGSSQILWGSGASDTSCAGNYSASCAQGKVVASGTITAPGGASIQFTIGGGFYSSSNNSVVSSSWTLPDIYTYPSGLTVSIARSDGLPVVYANGAKFVVNLTDYGNPSSEDGRCIEAAICGQNHYGANYRYRLVRNVKSAEITVDNTAAYKGTITIASNTMYYYGAFAYNTEKYINFIQGTFATAAGTPTATNFTQLTSTSASFSVTETSDGTYYVTQLEYRYKIHSASSYGEWTSAGATGNKQTRSVTLSGLTAGASYDVQVRTVSNPSGSSSVKPYCYSAVRTYENAFTLLKPTAVVTGATYAYDSTTDKCICTFSYNISATGSGSETYTVNYKATASDSTTTTGSFTTSSTTGTFQLTLPRGVSYTLQTWVGSNGDKSTFSFTSPDFSPTIDFSNMVKNVRGTVISGTIYGSMGLNAGSNANNTISYSTQVYNADTNAWEASGASSTTYSNLSESYSRQMTFSRTGESTRLKHPPKYAKLKFIVTATNKYGLSTTKSIVVKMPPFVWGKVVTAGGEKLNVVGVMIKDSSGTLTDGRYYEPFKIR